MGNFVADAFVYYYAVHVPHEPNAWTSAAISMIQYGGIRTTLGKGGELYDLRRSNYAIFKIILHALQLLHSVT